MGPCLLDSHLGNPIRSSATYERRSRRRNPVVVQFRRCKGRPEHAGYRRIQWLWVSRLTLSPFFPATNVLYSTYLIFGSFCVCMFFFVWFLIPETKGTLMPPMPIIFAKSCILTIRLGVSLEHMDELFGVPSEEKTTLADKKDDVTKVELREDRQV
jgi:hypothetical protein